MPVIDIELVQPLNAITDTLLKRPGVVTMQSIKRLSEMYGFTTFVEHIKAQHMMRLSISGLVLLIDVDFEIPIEMQNSVGSPMSPTGGMNNSIGILSNSYIKGVSISSAITPDPIDNESYDFLFGFKGFPSCSDVLFNNLKEKTLDSFNMNLRVLLLFDRLSKNKPDDLFTMFTQLVWGLSKQVEYEKSKNGDDVTEDEEIDWVDGVRGIGKVLANQNNKVGVFLQYWIDDRYVHRWIRENKGMNVVDRVYMMHFKVKESLSSKNYNTLKTEIEEKQENNKPTDGNNDDEKAVIDGDGDVIMNKGTSDNTEKLDETTKVDDDGEVGKDNDTKRLFNILDGTWDTSKQLKSGSGDDTLSSSNDVGLVILEFCPPVWIPEDALVYHGTEYELINEDNENWSDNNKKAEDSDLRDDDEALNKMYKSINESKGENNGCVELVSSEGNKRVRIDFLVGCKMVRVFKVQVGDLNKLRGLVSVLRMWCKVNSMLRKVVSEYKEVGVSEEETAEDVTLDEVFGSSGNGQCRDGGSVVGIGVHGTDPVCGAVSVVVDGLEYAVCGDGGCASAERCEALASV